MVNTIESPAEIGESALAEEVLAKCQAASLRLATAESCTGGMVGAALTDIAGSSSVVLGGIIAYSNAIKSSLLGVRSETLDIHGAVSEAVAVEMANGAMARMGTDLAVAITGIAGPGGSERKPEGRVCFAVARRGQPTEAETQDFGALGRAKVREVSRDHALKLVLNKLSS
jgi:nicotinamide-nucleotide amidase